MTRICIINGHPDPAPERFAAALTAAYVEAARAAGHTVSEITVGNVPLDFLENQASFDAPPSEAVAAEREKIAAADHLVLVYPMWLGTMPARLKAFLEHAARNGFFLEPDPDKQDWPLQKMNGKSARVIVTMGMSALLYRLFLGAHSVKSLERMILRVSGFKPVHSTIFGSVHAGVGHRDGMLKRVRSLGAKAA